MHIIHELLLTNISYLEVVVIKMCERFFGGKIVNDKLSLGKVGLHNTGKKYDLHYFPYNFVFPCPIHFQITT
jgi:hypothetical protein